MTSFPDNGDGWFETNLGYSASSLVKRLKKARRHNKDNRDFIDKAIEDVRSLKAMEMDATLKMHDWSIKHSDTIRDIGVNDKDMRALRKFGDSRKVSLQRACHQWERAEDTLKMLNDYDDVWGDEQKKTWVDAMQAKRDARKVWKTTLNQMERLTNKEKEALRKSADILQEKGQMTGRTIHENLMEKGVLHNSMTAMKLSKLLSMYGEEVDVISGNQQKHLREDGQDWPNHQGPMGVCRWIPRCRWLHHHNEERRAQSRFYSHWSQRQDTLRAVAEDPWLWCASTRPEGV